MVFMTTPDPYCEHLASPNPYALALSVFLVLGILFSYLPQHYKIISHGTSAGLSPWWVLLGTLSSLMALANILVLPTSQHDMQCCRQISGAACAAALLGVVQISVQWVCFTGIWALFLIYFPRKAFDHPEAPHTPDQPNKRDAVTVGIVSVLATVVIGIVSTGLLVRAPGLLLAWANTLGIVASILATIQYVPQLWTTWKLKHIYSLSIMSMIIQVPGSFIFAFSLWLRVGWQGWSTWVVYCVTGLLQGGLLAMAIYFQSREKDPDGQEAFDSDETAAREATESDPLLPSNVTANGRTQS